jgi:hypothetical protein
MPVDEKKKSIRASVQELNSPASTLSAYDAMNTLFQAVFHDFDDEDSIGNFVGDDDFKAEIFSARVVQAVMNVSQDKEAFRPNFYHRACSTLSCLCSNSIELATAFIANGGVEFLLKYLEAFSSDQFLLVSCFGVHQAVIESLDKSEASAFAGMTLEKTVDVFELNHGTAGTNLYQQYCVVVSYPFRLGREVNNILFQRIASHVWHGIIKHKHDEETQKTGRGFLRNLVGEESAKEMIDHAEMHHCEDEECAGCA